MENLKIRINGELIYNNEIFTIDGRSQEYIDLCKRIYDLSFTTRNIFGTEIKKINVNLDGT